MLVWSAAIVAVASYFWNWVLGPPHLLSFPVYGLGLVPVACVVLAIAIRFLWSCIIRHHKITINGTYVLSQIRYYPALEGIVSSLSTLYHHEAAEVAKYVGQTFGVTALQQVAKGLEHPKWRVRVGCVLILGEIARSSPDDRRAVEYLLAMTGAGDPQLMRALVEALGGCRDSRIPHALEQLLLKSRTSAFMMQYRLAPLSKWGTGSEDEAWNEDTIARFDELVKKYHPPFLRAAALQAMGVLRIPDCEDRLGAIAISLYEDNFVRQGAIRGLGLAQTPLAVERLTEIAEQRRDMRRLACTVLQQIRNPATAAALATAAESTQWEVRRAVAVALGATGRPEAFGTLELLAGDDDYDVREAAAHALSLIDLPAAVPVLGRLAQDRTKEVRRAALEGLNSRYPHLASPVLVGLAEDDLYPDRVQVIRSLGHHAHPGIEEDLNNLLASPHKDVRAVASEALRALQTSAGKRKQTNRRFNPFSRTSGRLATWLQLDGFKQLVREERLAGIPDNVIFNAVYTRVLADAELTRRYRLLFRLVVMLFEAFIIFGLFTLVLAFRFSLWSAMGMLGVWPYFVGLLAFGVITYFPVIRYLNEISLVHSLRQAAFLVMVISLLAGVFYAWWIVTPAVVAAALLIVLVSARRRRRRGRDVRAALRLAHAALTPAP